MDNLLKFILESIVATRSLQKRGTLHSIYDPNIKDGVCELLGHAMVIRNFNNIKHERDNFIGP
jgi:hypothetical protein